MMANNWQRMDIWLKQKNRFDYIEFESACAAANSAVLPVLEFAQKAGMITCASQLYTDMNIKDAYLRLLEEHKAGSKNQSSQIQQTQEMKEVDVQFPGGRIEKRIVPISVSATGCPSCGGGRVL